MSKKHLVGLRVCYIIISCGEMTLWSFCTNPWEKWWGNHLTKKISGCFHSGSGEDFIPETKDMSCVPKMKHNWKQMSAWAASCKLIYYSHSVQGFHCFVSEETRLFKKYQCLLLSIKVIYFKLNVIILSFRLIFIVLQQCWCQFLPLI